LTPTKKTNLTSTVTETVSISATFGFSNGNNTAFSGLLMNFSNFLAGKSDF